MLRSIRLLVPLLFTAPLLAQFAITVQENGQAVGVSTGSSITFNAPAIGQSITATVTVTYVGSGTAVFPGMASLAGPSTFSGVPGPVTLNQGGQTSFSVVYTAKDSTQNIAQFLWAYNLLSAATPPVVTANGALSFGLVGTAPNLTIGQISSTNSFVAVPNGGTIAFPSTAVNSTSTLTIALSNPGSGTATINSITTSGAGFQLQGLPVFPITLPAGNQLNVTAVFTPTAVGAATGGLQIAYAGGTYTASFTGTGVSSFLNYQLIQDATTSPLAPNQTITFDDTKVGSKSTVMILLQNQGTAAITVSTVALTGAAYAVTDGPFLPFVLQPQQSTTLTLSFTPTAPGPATGRLLIGTDNFPLTGNGIGPLLQYSYQSGSSTVVANPGDLISFPPVSVGQTDTLTFTISNTGSASTSILAIGVLDTKGIFQVTNLPALPATLAANASVTFSIVFAPQTEGQSTTTLLINNQQFLLGGFASAPPALPAYHFTGASGTQQPFQQPSIGLSLNSAYPINLVGTLTLTINSNSFVADPAVQFSTSGVQVAFTIPANTLQAVFPNGSTSIRLQTGTVAGSITVTPAFLTGSTAGTNITPANPVTLQMTVPSLAPVLLTAALGTRTTTGFSIVITGYSTTRVLQNLTFQIAPSSTAMAGTSLGTVSITVSLGAAAAVWFQTSESEALGSQFDVEIPFTLTSSGTVAAGTDLTKSISSVSVVAMNDVGSSNSLQVVLP